MKKLLIYIFIFSFSVFGLVYTLNNGIPNLRTVADDSGWDSDYDSDSSWDSDSSSSWDYDSSSSWDSDYSSSGGVYGSSIELQDFITFTLFFIPFLLLLSSWLIVFKGSGGVSNAGGFYALILAIISLVIYIRIGYTIDLLFDVDYFSSNVPDASIYIIGLSFVHFIISFIFKHTHKDIGYSDCSSSMLEEVDVTDIDKIKDELYQKFIDVQNAWMEFDYDSLSKLCSSELYSTYKAQLEVLKVKNGKNIMHDFKLNNISIISASKNGNMGRVKVYLDVTFYDYVIDCNTDIVIRGRKNVPVHNRYILEYTKKLEVLENCPSCGCKITNDDIKCPACGTNIINNSSDFVLASKRLK